MEGLLYRHMIMKDASRDSNVYSLLNCDWDKGARFALFKKLHGVSAARRDVALNKKESEEDEKQRVLEERVAEKKKNI